MTARISCERRVSARADDGRAAQGPGVVREEVEHISPGHLDRLATIVRPVVASGLPTVLWFPDGYGRARSALHDLADVVLLDSDADPRAGTALVSAAKLTRSFCVVDLASLRTEPVREQLAASFDPFEHRTALE